MASSTIAFREPRKDPSIHDRVLSRASAVTTRANEKLDSNGTGEEIVGRSRLVKHALSRVEQVGPTDATVLIQGETGTGKELFARAVHRASLRAGRPLVKVNCAAIPNTLIESEFFGHEKGAFTGALTTKVGRFELANGGTIFLDEIGDLSPELQAKLLRVLQEGEFERLGSTKTTKVDVRVIAATNQDLEEEIKNGHFRMDLYYRLKVFPVSLPPLRKRPEDIKLLVWYFIAKRQTALRRRIEAVPAAVMDALEAYHWPGNVRELENLVERAMIVSNGATLTLDGALSVPTISAAPRSERLEDVERAHIISILDDCEWKLKGRGNAAERLGINPSTLRSRMKKLLILRPLPHRVRKG